MVIGTTFVWGHLGKTGGKATKKMFDIFPELVVWADDHQSDLKHSTFRDRREVTTDTLRVANIRRLPRWILSWSQHRSQMRRPPEPMRSPYEMAETDFDQFVLRMTDGGRLPIDRWLRTDHLVDDFLAFVSELTDVDEERRRQVAAVGRVNPMTYDSQLDHWFTQKHIERMREVNPVCSAIELEVYGDLLELG